MIRHPAFTTEPWSVRECRLHTDVLAQTESVFALSNGHIGLRGNLDEGEPYGLPGTYLNSYYELRPLPYAEAGYGYPESGQTVVNVTNGKLIRLLVDDEPFDVRYGTLHSHERLLDLRAGTLIRTVHWSSPTGAEIRMRSTRLVSYTHRAVAAIRYEVEPVDQPVNVVVQSELVANETVPTAAADPAPPPHWRRHWCWRRTRPAATACAPWSTPPGPAGCGSPPRCATRSTAPEAPGSTPTAVATSAG